MLEHADTAGDESDERKRADEAYISDGTPHLSRGRLSMVDRFAVPCGADLARPAI
jgi:hypothetical protein